MYQLILPNGNIETCQSYREVSLRARFSGGEVRVICENTLEMTDRYTECHCLNEYDIIKEGIFVRFPELIPAASKNYWNSKKHKRLLIIGECNYFDDNVDSVYKIPKVWYKGKNTQHLIPKEKKSDISNYKSNKTLYRLCKTMNDVLGEPLCKHVYDEAMFYNYFLRPATLRKNDKSFKKDCTRMDRKVAGIALNRIIDIDHPDIIIFISKYAYMEYRKYMDKRRIAYAIPTYCINHPASHFSWYHRNGNGKQKFERLLRGYWIVK